MGHASLRIFSEIYIGLHEFELCIGTCLQCLYFKSIYFIIAIAQFRAAIFDPQITINSRYSQGNTVKLLFYGPPLGRSLLICAQFGFNPFCIFQPVGIPFLAYGHFIFKFGVTVKQDSYCTYKKIWHKLQCFRPVTGVYKCCASSWKQHTHTVLWLFSKHTLCWNVQRNALLLHGPSTYKK